MVSLINTSIQRQQVWSGDSAGLFFIPAVGFLITYLGNEMPWQKRKIQECVSDLIDKLLRESRAKTRQRVLLDRIVVHCCDTFIVGVLLVENRR